MSHNPLFDNYQPSQSGSPGGDPADLIRQKVADLYQQEPDARQELQEAQQANHLSKHQQFMYELGTSGKDLASIQTEWHNYYQTLSDQEKHQVWQEFYSSHRAIDRPAATPEPASSEAKPARRPTPKRTAKKLTDVRTASEVRETIRNTVSANGKLTAKHHVQSLLFGLGTGAIVLIIILFGLFNEVVLAPLYQPSRHASATPIIVDSTSDAPTDKDEVIIPKINLEVPINFGETSTDESVIENDLESGVVHYPTTAMPGQNGNAAFFGHSSSNIFNKGKYKFAFVLLHAITPGDTFYITYNHKAYVYKVISRTIVDPSDIGVLNPVPGQTATATLITCDPPGTSLRRLVVVGQQITPDPSSNTVATQGAATTATAAELPGNGQTLPGRLLATTLGKIITILLGLGIAAYVLRKISQTY